MCRGLHCAPSLQQREQVGQQELRYLWVWVSLSATEAVRELLLDGHPSSGYLEEVQTLLLDVQQGLLVSMRGGARILRCGMYILSAAMCMSVCVHKCVSLHMCRCVCKRVHTSGAPSPSWGMGFATLWCSGYLWLCAHE